MITVIDSSQPNPLAALASSTYTLSFFMVDPSRIGSFDAESRVITRANGYYLIAQSGGSNKRDRLPVTATKSGIIDQDNLHEFFIDNLSMTTIVNTKHSKIDNNPVSYNFRFKITEPIGASFLMMLRSTFDYIKKHNPNMGLSKLDSSYFLGQIYGLKISFKGYDKHGVMNTNAAKDVFYTLKLSGIKTKFDGRVSTYEISAVSIHEYEGNSKYAVVPTNMTVAGTTVKEILNDFSAKLDQYWIKQTDDLKSQAEKQRQQNLRTDILDPVPNEYEFDFDSYKFSELAESPFEMLSDTRMGTSQSASNNVATPSAVTVKAESDPSAKTINRKLFKEEIVAGTSIYSAISSIVRKSMYIRSQFDQNPDGSIESSAKPKIKQNVKKATYYSIIPVIAVKKHDNTKNEYSLRYRYIFMPYEIAYSDSHAVSTFHSPVLFKRYQFSYTGKNTDIKSFDMNMDNTYYLTGTTTPTLNALISNTPIKVEKSNGTTTNQPTVTPDQTVISDFIANFSEAGSRFSAKLNVLGDPGFLIADPRDIAFNKSGEINPYARATYYEVNFNVGIDYNYDSGQLDISSKLKFNLTQDKPSESGMVFMVTTVTSNFNGGEFTQEIESIPVEGAIVIRKQ